MSLSWLFSTNTRGRTSRRWCRAALTCQRLRWKILQLKLAAKQRGCVWCWMWGEAGVLVCLRLPAWTSSQALHHYCSMSSWRLCEWTSALFYIYLQAGRPESEIRIYNISSTWHKFEGSHWSHRKYLTWECVMITRTHYQRVHMNNYGECSWSFAFLPVKFRLLNDEFGSCSFALTCMNQTLTCGVWTCTRRCLPSITEQTVERANLAIWALVQAEHADWKSQDWTTHLLMSRWSALTLTYGPTES